MTCHDSRGLRATVVRKGVQHAVDGLLHVHYLVPVVRGVYLQRAATETRRHREGGKGGWRGQVSTQDRHCQAVSFKEARNEFAKNTTFILGILVQS
jgi:hypothetical protein